MLQVSVYRFNPETDAAPQMQEYQVETGGKDLMVLDVLEMIKSGSMGRMPSANGGKNGASPECNPS